MKKFVSVLACVSLAATMSVSVFAGSMPPQEDKEVTTTGTTTDTDIPVWGYVGPEADITGPTDPTDPTDPPVVSFSIDVSVPVVMLWAAFEPSYTVSGPQYHITNNSDTVDVDVVGTFTQGQPTTISYSTPLTLDFTGATAPSIAVGDANVALGKLVASSSWQMDFAGQVDPSSAPINGNYAQPDYSLNLAFAVA